MSIKNQEVSIQLSTKKVGQPFNPILFRVLIGLLLMVALSACVGVAQPTGSSITEAITAPALPKIPAIDPALDGRNIKEHLERPGYYDIYPATAPETSSATITDLHLTDGREIKERLERPGYYDIYSTEAAQVETSTTTDTQYLDGREYKEWLEQHNYSD
jgi:hypothetical protein